MSAFVPFSLEGGAGSDEELVFLAPPPVVDTYEDPEAVRILGSEDPRLILRRRTLAPGEAREESYLEREAFLKHWRG